MYVAGGENMRGGGIDVDGGYGGILMGILGGFVWKWAGICDRIVVIFWGCFLGF